MYFEGLCRPTNRFWQSVCHLREGISVEHGCCTGYTSSTVIAVIECSLTKIPDCIAGVFPWTDFYGTRGSLCEYITTHKQTRTPLGGTKTGRVYNRMSHGWGFTSA